jgi:hypothetical protein
MIRINSDDGSRILIDALRSLDNEDLTPATLAVREPSLDDVFLALTGHRAAAGTEPAATATRKRRGRRAGGDA